MSNTGALLDQKIAQLERELAFAREGTGFLITKLDAMRSRLALPGLCPLEIGDEVEKTTGDYRFRGVVRAVLVKESGAVRVVVENSDGLLYIFNPDQLTVLGPKTP